MMNASSCGPVAPLSSWSSARASVKMVGESRSASDARAVLPWINPRDAARSATWSKSTEHATVGVRIVRCGGSRL